MGYIFRRQVPRAPSIVRWHAPSPSWFKLNTDGSSLGNPGLAGAAGIIRDSAGHVHLAYQFALGTGTSVLAELTAVWRGMELALTHGLAPFSSGGGCHDGDLALTVPCFREMGGVNKRWKPPLTSKENNKSGKHQHYPGSAVCFKYLIGSHYQIRGTNPSQACEPDCESSEALYFLGYPLNRVVLGPSRDPQQMITTVIRELLATLVPVRATNPLKWVHLKSKSNLVVHAPNNIGGLDVLLPPQAEDIPPQWLANWNVCRRDYMTSNTR
ncbi:UNVERIFIED_CONTAM: putative ribonuclease H protein [Sesamum angustifolium]|uniref:Ribonuclease H protein n=1 Tax=Sesamum angustifolium TaxID=2727405 RepID=A0AAW2IN66_9LAMI